MGFAHLTLSCTRSQTAAQKCGIKRNNAGAPPRSRAAQIWPATSLRHTSVAIFDNAWNISRRICPDSRSQCSLLSSLPKRSGRRRNRFIRVGMTKRFLALLMLSTLFIACYIPSQQTLQQNVLNARRCDREFPTLEQQSWWSKQSWWLRCGGAAPLPEACEPDGTESKPECMRWSVAQFGVGQTTVIGMAGGAAGGAALGTAASR